MAITVCQCPISTTLASVVTSLSACKLEIGQIQKLIFWRHGQSLSAAASAISSSVWTIHLTATGNSKAVVSPLVTLNIPQSEPREVGSGNEVINGMPIVIGTQSVKCEGRIWETLQSAILKMKALGCENLDVMFINENNQLIYSLESGAVKGFHIGTSLFVSDVSAGSYADGTKNMFHFYLPGGWSDTLTVTAATTFLLDMVNT
jgi:hypothetical protein